MKLFKPLLYIVLLACVSMSCQKKPSSENSNDSTDEVVDVDSLEQAESSLDAVDTIGGATEESMTMLQQIDEGKLDVLFHGYGTEPYWDVYLTEKKILIRDINTEGIVLTVDQAFDKTLVEQTVTFDMKDGVKGILFVKKEPADDGMSDFVFPYSASYNGQSGCGDINAMDDMSIYLDL